MVPCMGNYYRVYLKKDLDDRFRGYIEKREEETGEGVSFNSVIVEAVRKHLEGHTQISRLAEAAREGARAELERDTRRRRRIGS